MQKKLRNLVEDFQDLLISIATQDRGPDIDYEFARAELMGNLSIASMLPEFVERKTNARHFWQFIKAKFPTYAERRAFIWDSFAPILNRLASTNVSPSDDINAQHLATFDESYVTDIWQKALQRRSSDPEGAITAARTLLETTCKHILGDLGIESVESDLPRLYKTVAKELNLSPSQHTEQTFKAILTGCSTVVDNLGTLRNKMSDSHGQGKLPIKPSSRHAKLAVDLAGAMASFLVSTWLEKKLT